MCAICVSASDDRYKHSSGERGGGGGGDRLVRTSASGSAAYCRSERSNSGATYTHTSTVTSSGYSTSDHRHGRHNSGDVNHHRPSPSHQKIWHGAADPREYRRDSLSRSSSETGHYDRYGRRTESGTPSSGSHRPDSSSTPFKGSYSAAAAFNGARAVDTPRNENEGKPCIKLLYNHYFQQKLPAVFIPL